MPNGIVTFEEDRCKGCGLCVDACPKEDRRFRRDADKRKGYNPAYVTDMDRVYRLRILRDDVPRRCYSR
jgi:2-oxoglutarate ferredoxin oxidoreductase subunit delta